MTFTIPVKWVETFGDPTTAVNLCNGEPFTLSTKSANNGKWYGRTITINEDARTLVFDTFVDPRPANSVDALIAKIQSQVFTDTTWADCEAAKAAWDALSAEEKLLVEEYDYFGLDTGDASADDPRNQDGIGEKEILVVSFGTSFNDSRVATIKAIEDAIDEEFGDEYSVRRAFTAQIIINHIYARDGEKIDNMDQALDRAVANGVKELVVQPTHLMHGAEYDELVEALADYEDDFDSIIISEPLLGPVGADATAINADKLAVAEAVVAAACEDAGYADAAAAAADGAAIVLMGHGTAHVASITYEQMQTAMGQLGYENVFIGTVEGEPESTKCSNVIAAVKAAGYTKVYLRPLMVVAGDHANNDMADPEDEESWFSQFTAEGNFAAENVFCQIKGLGEIPDVQQIYIQHIKNALGVETELTISNNTGMFKAVTASYIPNADGSATLKVALSGNSYHNLFKGTYEQAVANGTATENWIAGYTNDAGKVEFLIPVAADEIGKFVPVVSISDTYYQKYLDGQNSLERAFYPRQLKLDTTANTLVTGDFEKSDVLALTNNVGMFKLSGAVLNVVGGPNSNNYKADLVLTMGSTAYTKAFLGRIPEADAALAAGSEDVKELGEGNTFTIPVKWVETFGQPETLVDVLEEPFIISFYSNSKQIFYERQFTVDEAAKTLVVDPVLADYTAVDAALATVPENLSIYTDESVAAVTAAVEAVERGLTSDKQAQVDAMAQAIIDAVAGLIRTGAGITLRSAHLSLDGKISINFKVQTTGDGFVAKLYYEKSGFEQVAEVPLNSDHFVADPDNYDYYLVTYSEIPAKEMTQLLRIKVFDADGVQVQMETSKGSVDQYDYSVATWCTNKINAAAPVERDVMIAKALLNYGHYSQLALKYNDGREDRPENMPAAWLESEMSSVVANSDYNRIVDGGKELGAKTFILTLESDTLIKLLLSRQVSVKIDGKAVTLAPEKDASGNDVWAAYSAGVAAKRLHELKPFELTEGENSATIYYGCLSWANSKLANGSEDDQNLARAMYLYNAAARSYFGY
ncbi:MAG: sirohydrochlorin cobaltochelatase [Firmicutes bacterium]|nr:sirohydrochlorin cobaltochelatase [Bacillota bacterium]